jgi:general secretion pathway protein F
MQFRVLALRSDGSARPMVVEAADLAAARRRLSQDGLTPLELKPVNAAGRGLNKLSRGSAGAFDVDLFCQEMLALVTAGVTIGESLETLASKQGSGAAVAVAEDSLLAKLHARVREGLPLSAALAQYPAVFPNVLCESLRAAERTSDYAPALERFVRYRRLTREVREKLVAASVYPLILLGVSTLVLLFLVGYVVPRFADVYADMGDKLPTASRALLWVGSRIGAYPWLTLGALAAALTAIVTTVRSGRFREIVMAVLRKIPRLNAVIAAAEFSRLYRTLALLLHGGIPMVASLQVARGLLPLHLARCLDESQKAISEGRTFSDALREQGLSTTVADRFFRVGEGSGKLAEMIDRAADFHEEEVGRGADWLGRVIGPFLMLIMGVVIGLVVVLMYMPIFSLADAIQ